MSAAGLLVEARAAGLTISPAGDDLRVRGRLTGDLRERLTALKPELVALLREHRQAETSDAWSAAYWRIRGRWPGRALVAPVLLEAIDTAEADAEQATLGYRAGTASFEAFTTALGAWEDLTRSAAHACSGCGQPDRTVTVVMDDGQRFCGACLRGGTP
jgi:hypothetical protein